MLGVALASCSQGRQDPLGAGSESGLTEGRLTLGASGPNLMIDSVNVLTASQAIDEEVFTAFVKAGSAKPAGSETAEAVRMMGDYSGYAIVDGSVAVTGTSVSYDIKLTFYDYSNSASIFIGGGLQYLGSVDVISNRGIVQDVFVNGEIKFAGSYTGFVKYSNFLLPTDAQGNLISVFAPVDVLMNLSRGGSLTFNSGGNRYVLNPYQVIRGG